MGSVTYWDRLYTYLILIVQLSPTRDEGCVEKVLRKWWMEFNQAHARSEGMGRGLFHELYGETVHPFCPILSRRNRGHVPGLFQVLLIDSQLGWLGGCRDFSSSRVLQ